MMGVMEGFVESSNRSLNCDWQMVTKNETEADYRQEWFVLTARYCDPPFINNKQSLL